MTVVVAEVAPYPGERLLDFVTNRMSMSSVYQPLLIKALVESGGRCSAEELARVILLADTFAAARALKILMRRPRRTLLRHQIAGYDRDERAFLLPAVFASETERAQVIAECSSAIGEWHRKESPKVASRFFRVIEMACGRCQPAGSLASFDRWMSTTLFPVPGHGSARCEPRPASWCRSTTRATSRHCAPAAIGGSETPRLSTSARPRIAWLNRSPSYSTVLPNSATTPRSY